MSSGEVHLLLSQEVDPAEFFRKPVRTRGDLFLVGSIRSHAAAIVDKGTLGDAAHAMLPHLGQGANQAIEDGVALSVLLAGRDPAEVPDIVRQYEKLRRVRTDVIQAEARKSGLRYDSKYTNLDQRDRAIANSKAFRQSLFDYDVEKIAIAHLGESQCSLD